jgi:hypothetical protein
MMRNLLSGTFYLGLGAVVGYVSATGAIGSIGASPAGTGGTWLRWDTAPSSAAHPYAIAHYLLQGRFPPPAGQVVEFVTSRDKDGNPIDADCSYSVTGKPDLARWWSIAIPTGIAGRAANPVITAETAVLNAGGQLALTISPHPAPGNWLRPASDANFSLLYTVAAPAVAPDAAAAPPLTVSRLGC